jgi:hypothetical protein
MSRSKSASGIVVTGIRQYDCWPYFTETQRILIGSQIGDQGVKDHAKLHLLHIYHIVIQSELKYLIGAKVRSSRK